MQTSTSKTALQGLFIDLQEMVKRGETVFDWDIFSAPYLAKERKQMKDMFEAGINFKQYRLTPFKEVPKEFPDFETYFTLTYKQ